MPDVLGLSAFGLGDTCAGTISLRINAFHPSAVIFPRTWRGAFQTGREASESRIETGMNWPLEAKVTKKTILRRVPVALLWSKLVRDGDRLSYWAPGQGSTRFSTAAAIEAHLAELLKRAEWKDQSVVVAIPDTLDEMGQEEILRAFGERRGDVQLLWRPVAAAMEWLHGLETDFRIHPGDWMLVIYLGPDFFEFTPFGLQADGETGYPLPVRSRGIKNTLLTGMDWAWSCCPGNTPGEIWQQILRFPEVWEALVRPVPPECRHLWSRGDGSWKIWNAKQDLLPKRLAKAVTSSWLSTQIGRKNSSSGAVWDNLFSTLLKQAMSKGQKAKHLRGVVLCGPLVPYVKPAWLNPVTLRVSRLPSPNTIWISDKTDSDIIAEGAKLYGERLRDNLPTYLDTLPPLKIMTQDRRKHRLWTDLVAADTCRGGQVYTNTVDGFSYQKRYATLTVYLKKETENTYRKEVVPLPYAPKEDVPISMHVRMKPASGLAEVCLITLDGSIEELLFDFSRMEEITEDELPQEHLFCPDERHIALAEAATFPDEYWVRVYCRKFLNSVCSMSAVEDSFNAIRTKWLMPSSKNKIIDENGDPLPQFKDLIDQVTVRLVLIGRYADIPDVRLVWHASFLWGRTPETFRKQIVLAIIRNYGKKISKYYIEAAGRCFQTKEECRLLFNYIFSLDLHYAYALLASFRVLNYRPQAWEGLNDNTAYGLLKIAIDIMEEQRKDKKIKFRNAASLIFVLLKYRLKNGHMDFLGKNDPKARVMHFRERLEAYIQEIRSTLDYRAYPPLSPAAKKNLNISHDYLQGILGYIDYEGDPNIVPIMDEDSQD